MLSSAIFVGRCSFALGRRGASIDVSECASARLFFARRCLLCVFLLPQKLRSPSSLPLPAQYNIHRLPTCGYNDGMPKRTTRPPETAETTSANQSTELTNDAPTADAGTAPVDEAGTRAATGPPATGPRRQPKTKTRGGKGGANKGKKDGAGTETARLIEALLVSRGQRGASEAELEQVVRWAERIRAQGAAIEAEAAELRKLGPRGSRNAGAAAATRRKQQRQERQRELEERRLRRGLDEALLAGVLSGDITLDVQGQGELLFRHKQAQQPPAAFSPAERNGTETPLP